MNYDLFLSGSAVSSAGPICCLQQNVAVSCNATEKFEEVHRCDNRHGETQLTCEYIKLTGLSSTDTSISTKDQMKSGNLEHQLQEGVRKTSDVQISNHAGISLPVVPNAVNLDISKTR